MPWSSVNCELQCRFVLFFNYILPSVYCKVLSTAVVVARKPVCKRAVYGPFANRAPSNYSHDPLRSQASWVAMEIILNLFVYLCLVHNNGKTDVLYSYKFVIRSWFYDSTLQMRG